MINSNIKNYLPFLADHFLDEEINYDCSNYNNSLLSLIKQVGRYGKYIYRLHDSWIKDFKTTPNEIVITLNDFDTHVFADAIVGRHNILIDHDKLYFQLTITFKDCLKWECFEIDDEGIMTKTKNLEFEEYLYEHIEFQENGNIKASFVFWTSDNKRVLFEIETAKIIIDEHQTECWKSIFNNKYTDELMLFNQVRFNDYYQIGMDFCRSILNKYYLSK